MKMRLLKFVFAVLLCCTGLTQATEFDITISNTYVANLLTLNDQSLLVEGAGAYDVWAYGNSYIEIRNTTPYEWKVGGVGRALLFNNSSINVYGGETSDVTITNNSSMNIYGGELGILLVADNSSATLYGGNIRMMYNADFVTVGTEIDLEVVCKSWAWNEATNYITGIWGNNSSFNIQLFDSYWDNDEAYRIIEHISFTVIPEPFTGILMMMGVFLFKRRR
jgi:hypothetical protein